jgi:hypothetical protein
MPILVLQARRAVAEQFAPAPDRARRPQIPVL